MLICLDIGNTSIGIAFYSNPEKKKLKCIKKFPTHPIKSLSGYSKVLNESIENAHIEKSKSGTIDVIISSVVPKLNPLVTRALREIKVGKIISVNHKNTGGLKLEVNNKKTIGSDRIANAVGAYYHINQAVVVVDCGTATTFTVVGEKGAIKGGAILPGVDLMQKALSTGTAKLPSISLKTAKKAVGTDTISAINSGIIYGTAGAIERIIKNMEAELGYSLKLILTGGYGRLISPVLNLKHIFMPHLIFEGMRLIYLKAMEK